MTQSAEPWRAAIGRAREHSPFLAHALDRQPAIEGLLAQGVGEGALKLALGAAEELDVRIALRRERLGLAAALAIGDLAGAFALARVVSELTAFADRALDRAIAEAIRHRAPDADPAGFVALALGKQGAGELNYSSDIDPILLYDPATLPRRGRDEPGEAAQRIARRVVETLSTVDGDGYVLRVDLRLRPASEVSPLALSIDAATSHYESSALAWERAAYIRARAAAGDVPLGEAFLRHIRPFVWRRSLDFTAIDEIAALNRRIRETYAGPIEVGPGYDLKRGRGGIREVEFFAQTHQLIHGGRNPALRLRGTRAALDALAQADLIEPGEAKELGEAYDLLRRYEHRLQMVDDRQVHALPPSPEALDNVARLDGLEDGEALIAKLTPATRTIAAAFDRLVGDGGGTAPPPVPRQEAEDEVVEARFAAWREGRLRALRGPASARAFDRIAPQLVEALSRAPDPASALNRLEEFLERLPSAINIFRLLEARPALIDLVMRLLSLTPVLADELSRRGDLIDALIDRSAFDPMPPTSALLQEFAQLAADGDYQDLLDAMRRAVSDRRFALGVQLIEGSDDPLSISAGLSRVAEAALTVLTQAATREFERTHGRVAGSGLLILGLGRLGGAALTHASDLDLVFLYTGEHLAESNGPRPLGATLYFNRLAQRVIGAMTVPTAAGALYEVDVRLRPSGAQGPLCVTVDSFLRYQREAAWTWEHMALTRARVLYGAPDAAAALKAGITEVLHRGGDRDELMARVLDMRARMAEHKLPSGPLDAKLLRGGLVDLEFLVHFHQLADRVALEPQLDKAIERLVEAGLLAPEIIPAHAMLARLLVSIRLISPDGQVPPAARCEAIARALRLPDWTAVLDSLYRARQAVAAQWQRDFGQALEIGR